MKPLGHHPVRFPSKTDGHYKRPYVNWWESDECDSDENKAREKREAKAMMIQEMNDYLEETKEEKTKQKDEK